MNENVLMQLKTIVERSVRPVRAPGRRRKKMREELLAHVLAVYEEEAAKPGGEAAALERTRIRFGEPAELTASLQESVPWPERMAGHLQNYLCRRPDETALHFAVRHASLAGAYMIGAGIVGFLMVMLIFFNAPGGENRWIALIWLGLIILVLAALSVIAVLLWHGLWQSLHGATGRSYLRTALILVTASSIGPVVLLAITLQLTGDLLGAIELARPSISAVAMIPPFVMIFLADLVRRATAGPLGRSWLYTIAMDSGLAVVLAVVLFGVSLLITADMNLSFEHAGVAGGLVLEWLLPIDLVVSMPSVVARLRADQEWAALKID